MIRVLLVIDVPFYRDGLHRLLAQDGEITVVAAVSRSEAVASVGLEHPDLVLLDIGARGARECLSELRELAQAPRVVALAVADDEDSVVDWLEAGVSGYVSKNSGYAELIQVLHSAARGEWSCSAKVMAMMLRRLSVLSANAQATSAAPTLTVRERQILELVGKGLSNKRIAMTLRISHATAKNHVHHILSKLQLRSRAEIAAYLSGSPRPSRVLAEVHGTELETRD